MTFNQLMRFPVTAGKLALLLLVFALLPVASGQSLGGSSIAELKQLAEGGDVEAQLRMGDALIKGNGIPKNPAEGIQWIRKAADQGAANAYHILGICYDIGEGVPRDITQAVNWYRKAAEGGIVDSQYNIGDCYLRGEGVPKSVPDAISWFEKAAEHGDMAAVAQLGFIYLDDTYGAHDPVKAASHLRKSAYAGNNAAAKWALGTLYQLGDGVAQSDEDAVRWFRESAMQGDSTGMYHLALAMKDGRGTAKDELRAREWMEKSAAKGNPRAKEFLAQHPATAMAKAAQPATAPPALEKPPEPPASKPSFVSGETAPASTNESFTSFLSKPPGSEPTPRDAGGTPGFAKAPATSGNGGEGFTSFVPTGEEHKPMDSATLTNGLSVESAEDLARQAAEAAMASLSARKADDEDMPGFASTPREATAPAADLPSFATKENASLPAFAKPKPAPVDPLKTAPETSTRAAEEPRIIYREGGGNNVAFPVAIAYMTLAMASAMVIISLMFFLTFKTRIRSLEGEIKKAQFELSKANVNLSSMMHQVEQLALKAPEDDDEGLGGLVSLPEWDDIKSQASAEGFKISRAR